MNAVYLSYAISIIISFIVLGSTVAIDAVVSLCTLAAFCQYTVPISCFLWYRLTHDTVPYGPWRMGKWGPLVNVFALCWCIFFVVILPFPSEMPVTAQSMNWAGPIFLAVVVLLTADWVLRARKTYQGPLVELDGMVLEDDVVRVQGEPQKM